jgi:hypothetical protein
MSPVFESARLGRFVASDCEKGRVLSTGAVQKGNLSARRRLVFPDI